MVVLGGVVEVVVGDAVVLLLVQAPPRARSKLEGLRGRVDAAVHVERDGRFKLAVADVRLGALCEQLGKYGQRCRVSNRQVKERVPFLVRLARRAESVMITTVL